MTIVLLRRNSSKGPYFQRQTAVDCGETKPGLDFGMPFAPHLWHPHPGTQIWHGVVLLVIVIFLLINRNGLWPGGGTHA